ncbi:MAG TPA: hypothetical protein VIL97_05975 [Thermoanaerobaculia bacterium]
MRPLIAVALLLLSSIARADESPEAIAARAFEVMAGPAWEKARHIAFTFNVERDGKIVASYPQRLDRYTGDYQVSGKDREGRDYVVNVNANTREGRAKLAGAEVAEPKELLETGYRRFINDTYWLLMPLKLRDPGVTLESAGTRDDPCGNAWDVVKLTFDSVGLTPGDQYWVWVNRDTGLSDWWEMRLQDMKPEDPLRRFRMKKWERHGGILISTLREEEGGTTRILLTDIEVTP